MSLKAVELLLSSKERGKGVKGNGPPEGGLPTGYISSPGNPFITTPPPLGIASLEIDRPFKLQLLTVPAATSRCGMQGGCGAAVEGLQGWPTAASYQPTGHVTTNGKNRFGLIFYGR